MKNYGKMREVSGFTLLEVLITLAISGILMTSVYAAFQAQQDSYLAQEQVAEMQQNIRVAVRMLTKDIRMAGFDPAETDNFGFVDNLTNQQFDNGAGVVTAVSTTATQVSFYGDLDGDGNIDRTAEDINGDGNIDMSEMEQVSYQLNGTDFQRYSTTAGIFVWPIIAEQIQQIEFIYLDESNNPVGPTTNLNAGDISSVQISILARAGNPDQKFNNTQTYTTASGVVWGPFNDNFRRRFEVATVKCRNMGI